MKARIRPPMHPHAKGNQKASLLIIKGMNPRIVDTIVRVIGVTFLLKALK